MRLVSVIGFLFYLIEYQNALFHRKHKVSMHPVIL